jgi:hypothetical protein
MSYYINREQQIGNGLLVREAGQLEPSGRQLLSDIGDEEIKTIDIVRTPLSSFTKTFLNIISLGQFEKISKKYYDEMFHLSLWINGKYNLEKNEVVKFNRTNPKEAKSQVKNVSVIPPGITIQQLIDNSIKRMGKENWSNYDAERLNCQNFVLNVLDGSNIGDKSDGDFIFQDASKIFQELPEYAKVLGKVSVKLGAIFNRLMYGEGASDCKADEHYHPENDKGDNNGCMKNHLMGQGLLDFLLTDKQKAENKKKLQDYTIGYLTRQGNTSALEAYKQQEGLGYGGADIGQIGKAAILRTWMGRFNNPHTGRPMRDTLNAIVHSGDAENSNQYRIDNPYNDIDNNYDPDIDYEINWGYLYGIANNNKRGYFTPITSITYPSRTLGAT